MVAAVQPGPVLRVGAPQALFRTNERIPTDATPDGNRLLVLRQGVGATFVTVTAWFEKLRRRAPWKGN